MGRAAHEEEVAMPAKNAPRIRPWYIRRPAAKIIITGEQKPVDAPISYIFRNDAGAEVQIEARNIHSARYALNKQTGKAKGYRLVERRL